MKITVNKTVLPTQNISPQRPAGHQLQTRVYPAYEVTLENDSASQVKVNDVLFELNGLSIKFPGNISSNQIIQPWGIVKSGPQMPELIEDRFTGFHPNANFSLIGATIVVNHSGGTESQLLP